MLYFPSGQKSYNIKSDGFRVGVGDLILLETSEGFQVAGYVVQHSIDEVILSLSNPRNLVTLYNLYLKDPDEEERFPSSSFLASWDAMKNYVNEKIDFHTSMKVRSPEVTYSLEDFESYEILREANIKPI